MAAIVIRGMTPVAALILGKVQPAKMKTEVVNIVQRNFDIYIGRPSKWGNKFVIGKDGTRAEVIALYEAWIRQQPDLLNSLEELSGKKLGCHCKPNYACHGDVLLKLLKEKLMEDA